jgi:hypothetical protein
LDILFIPGILAMYGKWHAIVTFRNPEIPPRYCGFLYDPESEIRPPGKAKGLLDKLFHPAKIQPD